MPPSKGSKSNNPNGRPKGSRNKITEVLNAWFDESVLDVRNRGWKHPASILLEIANDTTASLADRRAAAKDILPYLKSSLQSISVEANVNHSVNIEDVRQQIRDLLDGPED